MSELADFGLVVLIVSGGLTVAIWLSKVSERFPIPGPALFLIAAAVASDIFPGLSAISVETASRIAVVALIVILFDGGMHVGWRRFRPSAVEITVLGTIGTFATAGVIALFARYALDFGWTAAGILGAALAPTDPAVMFSVLGKREIRGRSGTILEGESGANDPVGIALMVGILELATQGDASFWIVVREFAIEMSVGLAIGLAGAVLLRPLMRVPLPAEALYPIRTLALAGIVYGVAAVAHGSGFIAVFVAGLFVGSSRVPYKGEIERFHTSLASLSEIAVFVVLGLTIDLTDIGANNVWLDGLLLALLLAFVARPMVVGPLLLPARLRAGERLFVMWGGLKGAVPILLGTFVLIEGIPEGSRIYGIVFVVVAFSVVIQGTSIPFVAPRLHVPMRMMEPHSVRRYEVEAGSRAAGETVRELPIGDRTWIDRVVRAEAPLRVHDGLVLAADDQVWLVTDVEDAARLGRIFRAPGATGS